MKDVIGDSTPLVRNNSQIGPRQLELPPNMPDFESPGQ